MTKARRFLGGLASGYASQIVITLVGIWLTAFLLTQLGNEDYGLWLVATQIVGYLMLLDLGVIGLLSRDLAAAPEDTRPFVLRRSLRALLAELPLVLVIAGVVWIALPSEWSALTRPLVLLLAVFVVTFPARAVQAALQGLQDFAFLGASFTVTWLLGTAVTVVLVLRGQGLMALAVGWTVAQLVSAAVWFVRLRFIAPGIMSSPTAPSPTTDNRAYHKAAAYVSVSQVAQLLLRGTHLLIIGKFLGPAATVPFYCTEKLIAVLGNQVQLVPQTALPALSELRATQSSERLTIVTSALAELVLLLSGLVACVVLAVNEGFITWWVGPAQSGGLWLTIALVIGMILRHWNATMVYALFAFGHERHNAITVLADGIVTFVATVVLVIYMGIIGAALGQLIGVVLLSLPRNVPVLARVTGVRVRDILGNAFHPFARVGFALSAATIVGLVWNTDTLPELVIGTIAVGAGYALLIGPIVSRHALAPYAQRFLSRVPAQARPIAAWWLDA